jgi:SIR2-like domain
MSSLPIPADPFTVRETLTLFDTTSASFFKRFEEGGYALWLGSGISLGRLVGLSDIIRNVLIFLQTNINPSDPNCRFRASFKRALRVVLSDNELAAIDLTQPVTDWPKIENILWRLAGNYARLLDLTVDGEENDFLVWNAARVIATFADPTIEADAEHLCIGILALEGLLPEIMTANWDGLIERAAAELSGGGNLINVCVRPQDVRQTGFRVHLYKFHGCAVLAAQDEPTYRPLLIARQSQIDSWTVDHAVFVQRLVNIIVSKATLMIGLSAQDSNIRLAFATAQANLNWPWPGTFPAIVFSQTQLGLDQGSLLKNVYRDSMTPANRDEIEAGARIPTRARQLLVALVLQILWGKLRGLVSTAETGLPPAERTHLAEGLRALRNLLADVCGSDHYGFVRSFVENSSRFLDLFRNGGVPADPRVYHPLTMSPVAQIAQDASIPASGLQELAIAIAILGLGVLSDLWSLHTANLGDPTGGAIEARTSVHRTKVFFAASGESALRLFSSGRLPSQGHGIVIHSKTIMEPKQRSPERAFGRTGVARLQQVSISRLLGETTTAAELTRRFREEVML